MNKVVNLSSIQSYESGEKSILSRSLLWLNRQMSLLSPPHGLSIC
jgi:hypothetical protein